MNKINRVYAPTKLDKEKTLSLFKNQLRGQKCFAQCVLYRQASTYAELLKVITNYKTKSAILQEHSKKVIVNKVTANNLLRNEVGRVQNLKTQNTRSFHIEEKVVKLSDQLIVLYLMVEITTKR